MIITISGLPGSGKSTIAKELAARLNYKHLSGGDMQRQLAQKRGLSIHEYDKSLASRPEVDKNVEKLLKQKAQEAGNAVMDWRMGFHFEPESLKVFLYIKPDIGAQRIFKDQRKNEKENVTLEETRKMMQKRHTELIVRLKKVYGVDFSDKSNFDLVIDTSELGVEEIINKILKFLKNFRKA